MTKEVLSKLPLSTWCLLAFCLALVGSVLCSGYRYEFYCATLLLTIFTLLIASKQRESVIVFAAALGIVFANYFYFVSAKTLPEACLEARVIAGPKKFKTNFLYKVGQGNKSFVIDTLTDDYKISDKISLCRKSTVALEPADKKYILSQYKTENVYLTESINKIADGSSVRRSLFDLSKKIKEVSSKIYSGDQGVLAYGLIFGSSSEFSSSTKAELKKSGTTHLVAVSGYNVSIITNWIFGSLRFISKNFAGGFSIILLVFFYFLTGGSASVLRAGIMGAIILLSKFIGRRVLAVHLLLLAATAILIFNPFAIYDWGFQLSFLATAGLFFLAPALEKILSFGRFKSQLLKILSETLAAQIFVLPIMASNFGQISLIAPLSNLFILPFVPITMLFVFISMIASFIYSTLGVFFGGISNVLLSYIMLVIKFTANLKFASLSYLTNPFWGYVIGYAIVIAITILLRRAVAKQSAE